MKSIKTILILIISLALITLASLYLSIVFLLPKFLNSPHVQGAIKNFINKKYNTELIIDNFLFSAAPNLNFTIKVDNLVLYKDKEKILFIKKD